MKRWSREEKLAEHSFISSRHKLNVRAHLQGCRGQGPGDPQAAHSHTQERSVLSEGPASNKELGGNRVGVMETSLVMEDSALQSQEFRVSSPLLLGARGLFSP